MPDPLDDSVQYLRHVGPARAEDFAKLEVRTVRDLIFTFPRGMSDRTELHTIADSPEDRPVTILAAAVGVFEQSPRRRRRPGRGGKAGPKSVVTAEFTDESGKLLEVVWYNQPWLKDKLVNQRVILHGKAHRLGSRLLMEHPLYEIVPEGMDASEAARDFARILPVYPCAGDLNQSIWRKAMACALDTRLKHLEDPLPESVLAGRSLPGRREAVRSLHFPPSPQIWRLARNRLAWEECLLLQLTVLAARRHLLHDLPGRSFHIGPELDNRIRRLFPFRLTPAQDRAVADIVRDMESPLPMQRLLQGDVGSGKTAVAAYALLAAVANKAQACIMAPTGLLARQHFETFGSILANSPNARVRMGLLIGGLPAEERRVALERLANGSLDIVCATHSAIGDSVAFHDLGLAVIDEQHKFGVRQRVDLARKGVRPDTLVMTATPIPRSLALSVYGDLDLSVIDALPPGRKPVETILRPRARQGEAWRLAREELGRGRQAFVVCPLVEESEELDLRSAEEAFQDLSRNELKDFRLGLLHGRQGREEQRRIMDDFRAGRTDVLVSTVVVEVGVDVPNATVMLVEHAERFGLAQLHQRRGRVGGGTERGRFIMLSDAREGEAGERLAALLAAPDGFAVAEADLRIRGPGDVAGTRQHGISGLRLTDLSRDLDLLRDAREEAARLLEEDPALTRKEHLPLRRELVRRYGKQWDRVSGS
ncbi:MAG: ATP-dependent DNA helicase RecG [Planctomycetota bacterium]|nr:ATP-dependent DNA helicase RecG [Planctomycetota bacterium]